MKNINKYNKLTPFRFIYKTFQLQEQYRHMIIQQYWTKTPVSEDTIGDNSFEILLNYGLMGES